MILDRQRFTASLRRYAEANVKYVTVVLLCISVWGKPSYPKERMPIKTYISKETSRKSVSFGKFKEH